MGLQPSGRSSSTQVPHLVSKLNSSSIVICHSLACVLFTASWQLSRVSGPCAAKYTRWATSHSLVGLCGCKSWESTSVFAQALSSHHSVWVLHKALLVALTSILWDFSASAAALTHVGQIVCSEQHGWAVIGGGGISAEIVCIGVGWVGIRVSSVMEGVSSIGGGGSDSWLSSTIAGALVKPLLRQIHPVSPPHQKWR